MNLSTTIKMEEAVDFYDPKGRGRLDHLRRAGKGGEFYTPRAVTEFMTARFDPRLGSKETVRETALDPACGTGGFPIATIDHFEKQLEERSGPDDRRAIAGCIRGMEKKQIQHLLCTTNPLLHGIELPSMTPFEGIEDESSVNDYLSQIRETADMCTQLIVIRIRASN